MARQKRFECHVISNTHWDREWLYSFQETRMMLVDMMDKLLHILDSEPQYHAFLLDSQTAPLRDYLQVRPERSESLSRHISSGRLQVGPWYTCPEEFLVNGESLVRNLLLGHRIARQFGRVNKVGYSPFSYGQTSQMPQIYQGFGIDTILFYHGVQPYECRSEFWLEGPDGSRLFASRMGSFARYNFFYHVFRPVVYGSSIDERDYSWRRGGMPFHLGREGRQTGHYFLADPVRKLNRRKIKPCMEHLKSLEKEHCTTRYLAYMMGMDSTEPDILELKIIEAAKRSGVRDRIIHSSLEEWLANVRREARDLTVLKGERRTPRLLGTRVHTYGEVTSARTRMKRKNALAEMALQRCAEPFAVVASLLGFEYPQSILDVGWEYLLSCHAHDSIAGAGIDQIERDVHNRLEQTLEIAQAVQRRALQNIQLRIDNSGIPADTVLLTVFNPSPFDRSEVLTAFVDLPAELGIDRFSIQDVDTGSNVDHWEVARFELAPIVRHLGDATMQMPSLRTQLHLDAENIPALGYKTFQIFPERKTRRLHASLVVGQNVIENEHLRVSVDQDGTLSVLHRESGFTFKKLHRFQDDGEAGVAWQHVGPAYDLTISSGGCVSVSVASAGPMLATLRIDQRMRIPRCLVEGRGDETGRLDGDGDDSRRAVDMVDLPITSFVTLRRRSQLVEITTTFENRAKNHRLRVFFPTSLNASCSAAEVAFDVVERPIDRDPSSPWYGQTNPTHPHHRFVDVSDGTIGLAVINDGLREYEVTDDEERAIALTLMRAFEVALPTVSWRWERRPEMSLAQCPGEHEFRYAIYPHTGTWADASIYEQAERWTVPMEIAQAGPHPGTLPRSLSFLRVDPPSLVLSTLKKGDRSDEIILRLFNPTDRRIRGWIRAFRPIRSARELNLNEEPIRELVADGSGGLGISVPKKKILTVGFRLAES